MKNRAINKLIELRIPADLKGFYYIVFLMDKMQDDSIKFAKVTYWYEMVAKEFKTSANSAERNIRNAFDTMYQKCKIEVLRENFGDCERRNGNLLQILYIRLSQEG